MLFATLLLLLVYLAPGSIAKPTSTKKRTQWDQIVINACAKELESYKYDTDARGRHASICTYEPALGSWLHCAKDVLDSKKKNAGTFEKTFIMINQFCQNFHKDGDVSNEEFYRIFANASLFIRPISEVKERIRYPVIPNKTSLDRWVWAYFGPLDNLDKGNVYGVTICLYWIGVLFVAAVYHFLNFSRLKQTVFKNKVSAFLRGHYILPALVHNHAMSVGKWFFIGLVPTKLETLVLFGYVLLHGVLLSTYNFDHHELLSDHKSQVLIFLSDRAGILAFAHFPLIVLFGGKNSIMTWLTGIRYTAFITYHKWLGRFMLIDCAIHAIGYTYHAYIENYWKYVKYSDLWTSGRHAMIIVGILVFFSFFFFRRHYYELFVITHIILAIGFFHAAWRHCYKLGWGEWIIACALFWIGDRILRLIKIAIFGMPLAKLKLCGESMIEVRIPKSSKWWKAEAGQYIYLYFLKPKIFWQSHPFTVMDSLIEDGELVVVITVKSGLTKKLQGYLMQNEGQIEMRVLAEGPYGESTRTQLFEGLLFIAGGAGIPGPLSMAIKAGREPKSGEDHQIMKFVWSIRDVELLEVYKKEIMMLKELNVEVKIYYTGGQKSELGEEEGAVANMNMEGRLLTTPKSLEMVTDFGRPKIEEVIEDGLSGTKSLLVVCCGSEGFVDKTRELTAKKVLENGDKWIEYVEEFQNW
ncbi:FRE5-like protein [Saccharomyces kudriavzevii IFO 1802]|uniref:ferric-chelate reductase (NADPH) n=1 Tax=Saccharomyces kudriavzevii (strain ATCC MYA-4449 / AS 2.2408 / CBS 8840 / NBRC 1802 / NCYC 2889) TaxID=226230 RepID=J6EJ75_SACK1|nr:FRE5-like protein [Saccharomyces kudriavzevii IFO 1802]